MTPSSEREGFTECVRTVQTPYGVTLHGSTLEAVGAWDMSYTNGYRGVVAPTS